MTSRIGYRRTLTITGLILVAVGLFEFLNFTDFCYSAARYVGDQGLIDAAIKYEISHIDPEYLQGATMYASAQEFRDRNPFCCRLAKWGDPYVRIRHRRPTVWIRRVLGCEILIIELWYRSREDGPKPFSYAHYLTDACGNIRERASGGGHPDSSYPPTTEWAAGRHRGF